MVYGACEPGAARKVATWGLYVFLALVMHGMVTQYITGSFLVAPALSGVQGGKLFGVAGAVISALLFWKQPPRAPIARYSLWHALRALLAVPLIAMFLWFGLACSLASLWTRATAPAYSETVTLRVERHSGRGCGVRSGKVRIDGRLRNRVCLPYSMLRFAPGKSLRVNVIGRRSMLGFAIDRFEVLD